MARVTEIVRLYEICLLLKTPPSVVKEELEGHARMVDGVIKKFSGEILKTEDWGERPLAYPMRQRKRAHYFCLFVSCQPHGILDLRAKLRLNEEVMRCGIFRVNEVPDWDARQYLETRSQSVMSANAGTGGYADAKTMRGRSADVRPVNNEASDNLGGRQ